MNGTVRLLLFPISLALACSQASEPAVSRQPRERAGDADIGDALHAALDADRLDLISVEMRRGGCWTRNYTIRLSGNGDVTYEGRYDVRVEGKRFDAIHPVAARAILREFASSSFPAVDRIDNSGIAIAGPPTVGFSLTVGDLTKSLETWGGEEGVTPEVRALRVWMFDMATRIDELVDSERWALKPAPAKFDPEEGFRSIEEIFEDYAVVPQRGER